MHASRFIEIVEKAYNDGTIPKECTAGEIYGAIRSTILRQKAGTAISADFLEELAGTVMRSEQRYSLDEIAEGVKFWVKVWAEYRNLEKIPIVSIWECEYYSYSREIFRYEVRADENYINMRRRATVCYNWNNRGAFDLCDRWECQGLKFAVDRVLKVTVTHEGITVSQPVMLNEFCKPDFPLSWRLLRKKGIPLDRLERVHVELAAEVAGPGVATSAPVIKTSPPAAVRTKAAPPRKLPRASAPIIVQVPAKKGKNVLGWAWFLAIVGIAGFFVYIELREDSQKNKPRANTPAAAEEEGSPAPVAASTAEQDAERNAKEKRRKKAIDELVIAGLIRNEAGLDDFDRNGYTGLMRAVIYRKPENVRQAVEAGADLDKVNGLGQTALLLAIGDIGEKEGTAADKAKSRQCLEILIAGGADVNWLRSGALTPLSYAAVTGNVQAVKILLKAGADKNLRDERGARAIDYARKQGHVDVVKLLSK